MNIGGKIMRFSSLPSTNDLAKELAARGEPEGTVVIADEQTKGRGRKGRSWYSAPKLGLYASVIFRPPRSELSLLPLISGLAVREFISANFGLNLRLKWPNDLIWEGKKLGGLLLESCFSGATPVYAILGIGLNVGHSADDFPPELKEQAISLRLACGRDVTPEELLPLLWPRLNFWYKAFLERRDEMIVQTFEANHLFARGEEIKVEVEGRVIQGRLAGFNLEGALCLITPQGKMSFTAGEVSLKKA